MVPQASIQKVSKLSRSTVTNLAVSGESRVQIGVSKDMKDYESGFGVISLGFGRRFNIMGNKVFINPIEQIQLPKPIARLV